MRKLRRCVERNNKKARARRALMAMVATTVALSDAGAMVTYAAQPGSEIQITEAGSNATGAGESAEFGNEGSEGNTATGAEGAGTRETGSEGSTGEDAEGAGTTETGSEGSTGTGTGAESAGTRESGSEGSTGEDAEGAGTTETGSEGNTGSRGPSILTASPLRSTGRMLTSTPPANCTETISPTAGDKIDISAVEIHSGRIEVVINNSGSYTFTGNNKRNDAYVDVSIIIQGGVEADIYFDNFYIVNDDFEYTETTSIMATNDSIVNPIVVEGTANVHVKSNSEIKAVSDLFEVSGKLNFIDSEGEASLNCSISKIMSGGEYTLSCPLVLSGNGEVSFKDAKVNVTNIAMDGSTYSTLYMTYAFNPVKVYLDGTKLSLGEKVDSGRMYTSLSDLSGLNFSVKELYDTKGNRVYNRTLTNLPAGGQIVQIDTMEGEYSAYKVVDMKKPSNLIVDDNGCITNMLVTDSTLFYVKDGDKVEAYVSDEQGSSYVENCPSRVVSIKFFDASSREEIESYYSLKEMNYAHGCNLTFPKEDSKYIYTYKLEDGTAVPKDTEIKGDMEIYVSKVEKGKVQVTIDEVSKQVDYGDLLSSVGGNAQYYLDTESGKLVKGDEPITENGSFKTIHITTTTDSGKEWFVLNNEVDMTEFAEIVNAGNSNINGRLNADLHINEGFTMIGSLENGDAFAPQDQIGDRSFCGTFDGQNHEIEFQISKTSNYVTGLFGCISTGALIQNVVLRGSIVGGTYAGGIAGATFSHGGSVTIKNCINNANITVNGDSSYAGGLIGANLRNFYLGYGNMAVNINYCGNTGKIFAESDHHGGLIGYQNNANIFSSYNTDETSNLIATGEGKVSGSYSRKGLEGVVKSDKAFKSGEVTYLMNKAAGSNVWHQTCGGGIPSLNDGSIVYAGYANCHDTELSYANTEFAHTVQGHKGKGEYSYSNGKIFAKCEYCDEQLTADIICEPEELSNNMKGVRVSYSDDWTKANYPNIVIKYSDEEDGVYAKEVPNSVGEYYIKAYVGNPEREITVNDTTYTIKPKPQPQNNPNSGNTIKVVPYIPKEENTFSIRDVIPDDIYKQIFRPDSTADSKDADKHEKNTANDSNEIVVEKVYNEEEQKVNSLINDIDSYIKQTAVTAKGANNSTAVRVYEFSGKSVPSNLIDAVRDNKNIALKYETTYMGKKFEFLITSEDAKYFDKSIKYYGPLYINLYFVLKNLNMLPLFSIMTSN